ncbi:hypothetical protein GCM10007874_10640 [Labrys miyagiensis]|uniref:Uncharacterized protein n=2 Tax=Labrys miyagiensis TaxID=346912 RepID=A0ABQ6CCF1_9HYPH|nr:hypothetical protein GCM10007874_10640 [Labrys miyagiensis]
MPLPQGAKDRIKIRAAFLWVQADRLGSVAALASEAQLAALRIYTANEYLAPIQDKLLAALNRVFQKRPEKAAGA